MADAREIKSGGDYVDISLVAIFRRIRRHWAILLASVALTTVLSIAYAYMATPVYQSSILLAPATQTSSMGGMAGRLLQSFGGGMFGGGGAARRNEKAIALSALTSPYFTRAFIEENNLLPLLFPNKWDPEKNKWNVVDDEDIPTLSEGFNLFLSDIVSVDESNLNGLINVIVSWTDPNLAADWANKIVARVNRRLRQQAIDDADLTINYLNQELAKTNAVELQQSLYFLIETEIQKKTVAKVQKEYAWRVLSPAIPADLDKFTEPNRTLIISVGIILGLLFGLALMFILNPVLSAVREAKAVVGE